MAKQTKENKRGFVLYSNTLRIAERVLPKFEQRGQLLTMITAYTNGGEPPTFDKDVTTCFEFIRDGIEVNCDKYTKKREKQKQYYEEQKSKSKAYDELTKTEKSAQSEKTAKGGKSTTLITNNSNSNGDSHSVSNGNSDRDSNSDDVIIDNNFVVENKIDINNSISENKYTLPQVQEILERERIFFKQNWLRDFFHLNSIHYKWKFDPKSAALAYINLHPDALKEKRAEDTPPSSAAPPAGEVKKISEEYAKKLKEDGERIWAQLREELRAAVPPDKIKLLDAVQFAEAYTQGYGVWVVRLVTYTYNEYHDLQTNIFTGENWLEVSKKLRIKYVKFIQMTDWKKERG